MGERAVDEQLWAYLRASVEACCDGEHVAWMPAVLVNTYTVTYIREAVAMPLPGG